MSGSGVVMSAQRIVMSVRAGGTTDMIVQVTVPRTTADYGVLIPVPSEPTLDTRPVSSADLDALAVSTAPRIDIYESSSGLGCACAGGDDDSAGTPRGGGVFVDGPVNIGPVVAVVLTGDNADAVGAWLKDNGFLMPSSEADTLAQYVSAGSYFIAIRRRATTDSGADASAPATGGPSSVGIHYTLQGDHRKLSLGFTKIGAPTTLGFTLFIAAPQAIGPSAPFTALTLNDLDGAWIRSSGYVSAVKNAVSLRGSKAFVLEGATSKSGIQNSIPGIAQFMDDGAVITRATTVVDRSQLSDDVIFATPFSGDIPNRREVSLSRLRVRYASIGSFGILFIAHALRRRGRRRRNAGGATGRRA